MKVNFNYYDKMFRFCKKFRQNDGFLPAMGQQRKKCLTEVRKTGLAYIPDFFKKNVERIETNWRSHKIYNIIVMKPSSAKPNYCDNSEIYRRFMKNKKYIAAFFVQSHKSILYTYRKSCNFHRKLGKAQNTSIFSAFS